MINPAQLDLTAQRWTPFVYVVDFEGLNLTGATFAADIRLYRDAPGAALIALSNAAANAQGVSVSVTIDGDDVPTSHVQIRINETTLESLLLGAAGAGRDVDAVWDMHITGGGFIKSRWLEGAFKIRAGVTQNG